MKAIDKMSYAERGLLLAVLFPSEVGGILDAIGRWHYKLIRDRDFVRENWDNDLMTIDQWYSLANQVYSKIIRQGKQLTRPRRFADQLFSGDNALFTIDCIVRYAENEHDGSSFYHMVMALFPLINSNTARS